MPTDKQAQHTGHLNQSQQCPARERCCCWTAAIARGCCCESGAVLERISCAQRLLLEQLLRRLMRLPLELLLQLLLLEPSEPSSIELRQRAAELVGRRLA